MNDPMDDFESANLKAEEKLDPAEKRFLFSLGAGVVSVIESIRSLREARRDNPNTRRFLTRAAFAGLAGIAAATAFAQSMRLSDGAAPEIEVDI